MTLKGKPFLLAEDGHGEDKLAVFAKPISHPVSQAACGPTLPLTSHQTPVLTVWLR